MHGEPKRPVAPRRRIDAGVIDLERFAYRDTEVLAKIPALGQSKSKLPPPVIHRPTVDNAPVASPHDNPQASEVKDFSLHPKSVVHQNPLPTSTSTSPGQLRSKQIGNNRFDEPHNSTAPQPVENVPPSKTNTAFSHVESASKLEIWMSNVWICRVVGIIITGLTIWFALSSVRREWSKSTPILDGPNWPAQNLMRVADKHKLSNAKKFSVGTVMNKLPSGENLPPVNETTPTPSTMGPNAKMLPTAPRLSAPPTFDKILRKPTVKSSVKVFLTQDELQPPVFDQTDELGHTKPDSSNPTVTSSRGSNAENRNTDVRKFPDPTYQSDEHSGNETYESREDAPVHLNGEIAPKKGE